MSIYSKAKNKYNSLVDGILDYCVRKDLLRCAKIAIFLGANPAFLSETVFNKSNRTTRYIEENYFKAYTNDVSPKPQSKSWFAWLPSFNFLSWFKGKDVLAEVRQLNADIAETRIKAEVYNQEKQLQNELQAPTKEHMENIDASIKDNEAFLKQYKTRKRELTRIQRDLDEEAWNDFNLSTLYDEKKSAKKVVIAHQ